MQVCNTDWLTRITQAYNVQRLSFVGRSLHNFVTLFFVDTNLRITLFYGNITIVFYTMVSESLICIAN